jgi:hypothetical protein
MVGPRDPIYQDVCRQDDDVTHLCRARRRTASRCFGIQRNRQIILYEELKEKGALKLDWAR